MAELKEENIDTFINDSPSVPKVFLFTDRKGIPLIYKSLSTAFEVIINYKKIIYLCNVFNKNNFL